MPVNGGACRIVVRGTRVGRTALMGRWPSILTAPFTGLTALFAGFLWWETLTHDTLALKPSVAIYTGADPDTPPVGISITNWPWTCIDQIRHLLCRSKAGTRCQRSRD